MHNNKIWYSTTSELCLRNILQSFSHAKLVQCTHDRVEVMGGWWCCEFDDEPFIPEFSKLKSKLPSTLSSWRKTWSTSHSSPLLNSVGSKSRSCGKALYRRCPTTWLAVFSNEDVVDCCCCGCCCCCCCWWWFIMCWWYDGAGCEAGHDVSRGERRSSFTSLYRGSWDWGVGCCCCGVLPLMMGSMPSMYGSGM